MLNARPFAALFATALALLPLPGCTRTEVPVPPGPSVPDAPPRAPVPAEASTGAEPERAEARVKVEKVGFATPESIRHDVAADLYLVSNINGSPLAADGNGFISQVRPDGRVKALKWIDGAREGVTLNAPKGMAIAEGVLYVADLDTIRRFDLKTGAPKGEIVLEGATFLNDLALGPDGAIYVTDTGMRAGAKGFEPSGTDAVYRVKGPKEVRALARDPELGRPNGLFFEKDALRVVTLGTGELYTLVEGKKQGARKLPGGSLDGIEATPDGRLLISSWQAEAVFAGTASGPFVAVVEKVRSPADIGFDAKRGRILIPRFLDDALLFVPLPPAK